MNNNITATAEQLPDKVETVPKVEVLTGEVATARKDYFEPIFNGLMRPHDFTLLTRGGNAGIEIYDEIERDCHAFAVLQKRKMAVIAREWALKSASDAPADKEASDGIKDMLGGMNFELARFNLLDAILKGHAEGEIVYHVDEEKRRIAPREIIAKNQRRFVFDEFSQLRLLTLENAVQGESVPDMKFIVHRSGAKDGNPYGLGMGTRLFWPCLFKRKLKQFWLVYADKFGNPTPVGEYPPTATAEQKQTLLDAIGAIANDSGVIIPQGMIIKLLEAQGRGGAQGVYDALMRYLDEEISEAVLGETMTTSAKSTGLNSGQANVHNEVRVELTKADADLLDETLNKTLIPWLCRINYPNAKPPKIWTDVSEAEDLKSRAERDEILNRIGYRLRPDAVKEIYGDFYDFVGPQPGGGGLPFAFAEQLVAPPLRMVDNLQRASEAAHMEMMRPVIELMGRVDSLQEFRDRLVGMFPTMPTTSLAHVIGQALVAADLAGRREIAQGR